MSEFHGMSEDDILSRIEDGETLTSIAKACGISKSSLLRWINSDSDRSARVRASRVLAAASWDEMAEHGIREASDPFELSKAKEIAFHYRWRASKIAPKEYGDKVETTLTGEIGIRNIERRIIDPRD